MADDDTRVPVEMVVIPREEVLYEREAVFGRDASSVFPSLAAKSRLGGFSKEAAAAVLGGPRFITEKELEAIKSKHGPSLETGSLAVDRPLAAILAENKEKKEAEFQAKWKTMKTGKNRPLEADEVEFYDDIEKKKREDAESQAASERADMAHFQLQRAEMVLHELPEPEEAGPLLRPGAAGLSAAPAGPALRPQAHGGVRVVARPVIKVAPKAAGAKRPRHAYDGQKLEDDEGRPTLAAPAAAPATSGGDGGLLGLAYGSDEDDSSS